MPDIRRFYSFVIKDIGAYKTDSMLDVGTGPGDVPIALAKLGGISRICAVDPSYDMVRIARMRSKGLGIEVAQGSSRHVPFKGRFGIIISTLSFHHWAEKRNALRYLSTYLSQNGEIRIYEFDRNSIKGARRRIASDHSVTEVELKEAAKASGLRLKGVLMKDGFIRASLTRKR